MPPRFSRVPMTFLHPASTAALDTQSLFPECLIAHSLTVAVEMADRVIDFLPVRGKRGQKLNQGFDLPGLDDLAGIFCPLHPGFGVGDRRGVDSGST